MFIIQRSLRLYFVPILYFTHHETSRVVTTNERRETRADRDDGLPGLKHALSAEAWRRDPHSDFENMLAVDQPSEIENAIMALLVTEKECFQTHRCGELRPEHVGRVVRLAGWIQFNRMDKFVLLRDSSGVAQVISEDSETWNQIGTAPLESVLVIEGQVRARPADQVNKTMITGEVEVAVTSVITVSKAKPHLPFLIRDFHKANEALQMQHRFIALRRYELLQ